MHNRNNYDRAVSVASWVIVAALLYGSLYLWFLPAAGGPITALLGPFFADLFYCLLYGIQAVLLAYAKIRKKHRLRQRTLLAAYFTGIFTTILTVSLTGVSTRVIDNVVFALLSGGCWLYWKLRDDYLTREELCRESR